MKHVVLLFSLVCLLGFSGQAQNISQVDFSKVYRQISDDASPFYYPVLMERYLAHDTTLTQYEYHYLYYGFTQQPTYNPYSRGAGELEYRKLLEKGKVAEAQQKLLEDFKKSPFSLGILFQLSRLADMQQKTAEARLWMMKFDGVFRTIMESGDGLTEETAWVVIAAQDEYPIMGVLGLEPMGQSLLKSKVDVQSLKTPNQMEAEKLFFNVQMPFLYLSRSFKKESGKKNKL